MKKLLTVAALAGATIASTMFATADQANAQFRRWGPAVGLGIAAGVVTGAVIANSYPAPVRCGWVNQFDRWGNYLGRVRVCDSYPY